MNNPPSAAPQSVYLLRGERSTDAIANNLLALFPARHVPIAHHRFTVLDTFDARIRRAGGYLTRSGAERTPTLNWQTDGGGNRVAIRLKRPASFTWDLPDGPLRSQLASVIGPRRLLAQADAEERGSLLEMIDDRGKTVARLRIASGQARLPDARCAWRALPTMVTLTGMRGYEDAYERLVPVVESRPGIQPCPDGPVAVMLRHIGALDLGDLTTPGIALEPTVRADVGARQIHLALLDVLVANEPGLRANLDTEFLHDFRVAVRRARSLLGQIRGVFPDQVVQHFATEFSWIGHLTGPPRDTDVLVLTLRERHEEFSRDDMDELIAFLELTQRQEYERLVHALDSERYRRLLSEWKAYLESPIAARPEAPRAKDRLAATVSHRAWRLSKRIARRAGAVDEQTAAGQLHEIRIDAKKLRYLVDVTGAFYDAADFQFILGALKKLQRMLGDFNDAHVQEKLLLDCGRALSDAGGPSGVLLTLGRLAERSRQRREQLRAEVAAKLSRFGAKDVRKACRRAFRRA